MAGLTNQTKVSVIVPVYNPGERIEALIHSLAEQTLPQEQLEVIFVDDGSTDDTPGRLERACGVYPNMRLTQIPNSGWPGRPRNVGTDLAAGEYVFYADHDDDFFPESLERMYALAEANSSDIVYGKVVRVGLLGDPPAHQNLAKADPIADHLVRSRTVHKLYRRAFLAEHGIRFMEGRVRLEDHQFMAQALPVAQVVSVLADYPCYRWIHRNDGTNTSSRATFDLSPQRYWEFYAGALHTFAERAGEGELLDAARLVSVEQSFARYTPDRWSRWTAEERAAVLAGVRSFLTAEVPPNVDPRLPVLKRMRVAAIRAGDQDRFDRLQRLRGRLAFEVDVERVAWTASALELAITARLVGDALDAKVDPGAERGTLVLRAGREWGIPDSDRALLDADAGRVQLTVRNRVTGVEWPLECAPRTASGLDDDEPFDDTGQLVVRELARLDLARAALGVPLGGGIWDLYARLQFLGEPLRVALRPRAAEAVDTLPKRVTAGSTGTRSVRMYVTKSGTLALRVTEPEPPEPRDAADITQVAWVAGRLHLTVGGPANAGAVVLRDAGAESVLGPFLVRGGTVTIDLTATEPGQRLEPYLRQDTSEGVVERPLTWRGGTPPGPAPYAAGRNARGGLTVWHLSPGEAAPSDTRAPRRERAVAWQRSGRRRATRLAQGAVRRFHQVMEHRR